MNSKFFTNKDCSLRDLSQMTLIIPYHTTSFLWFYDQFQWRHLNMADQTKAKELKSRWQMLSLIPIPQWIKFWGGGQDPKAEDRKHKGPWESEDGSETVVWTHSLGIWKSTGIRRIMGVRRRLCESGLGP